MPLVVQHALVIALALTCAVVLLVRRVRVMRSQMSACSACAYAGLCEKGGGERAGEACEAGAGKRRLPVLREGAAAG